MICRIFIYLGVGALIAVSAPAFAFDPVSTQQPSAAHDASAAGQHQRGGDHPDRRTDGSSGGMMGNGMMSGHGGGMMGGQGGAMMDDKDGRMKDDGGMDGH